MNIMQNPITFLATQPTTNINPQQKNSANSSEAVPTSFKQVLSKEISEKENTPTDKSSNEIENKTIPQDSKKNVSSQPTKIEAINEDRENNPAIPTESQQTNGMQLIALVESLAQFSQINSDKSSAPTKSEISSIGDKAIPSLLDKASQKLPISEQAAIYPSIFVG